ncbi:MAG: MFS transporter [Chloroflexota bacterium]|nr:MFS transporter [Chloroflexota bacterium]MDE2883498.1 MFS transporter [Chloroflexota bacterium]
MQQNHEEGNSPPGRPAPARRGLHPQLRLILGLHVPAIALGLGNGLSLPVLPELTKLYGVSIVEASWVFVAYLLGTLVASLPTGLLIDRIGRRKILLAGPLVVALSSLLIAKAAVSGSFPELLAYRFIAGVGTQMWMQSRITVIADTGAAQQRGKQVTQMFGVQQVGALSGPLIGGFAAVTWGLWSPFLIHAVLTLLFIVPTYFVVKESAPAARRAAEAAVEGSRWGLMLQKPLPTVFSIQFLTNVTRGAVFEGGVILLYPSYAYGLDPAELGILRSAMAVGTIPILFTTGVVMDRFGRKYTIVPGLILTSLAMGSMSATAFASLTLPWFVASFVFVHLAISIISGNMQTLGTDVAPPQARGLFFGFSRLIAQGGSTTSPTSFGLLSGAFGFGAAFVLLASTAFIAGLVVAFFLEETLKRPEKAGASRGRG